jgi:hypothetical protein
MEGDSFDDVGQPHHPLLTGSERLEDLGVSERASSIRSSEKLLTSTQDRLAREYATLSAENREVVGQLAKDGFSQAAVEKAAPGLRDQRARMAKLRRRLGSIHRRLRLLAVPPGAAADISTASRLNAQIDAVSQMEQGAARSVAALQLALTVRPRTGNGAGVEMLKVQHGGAASAELGDALAGLAPDATAARLALQLLTGEGESLSQSHLDAAQKHGATDVSGLANLASAQLGS